MSHARCGSPHQNVVRGASYQFSNLKDTCSHRQILVRGSATRWQTNVYSVNTWKHDPSICSPPGKIKKWVDNRWWINESIIHYNIWVLWHQNACFMHTCKHDLSISSPTGKIDQWTNDWDNREVSKRHIMDKCIKRNKIHIYVYIYIYLYTYTYINIYIYIYAILEKMFTYVQFLRKKWAKDISLDKSINK